MIRGARKVLIGLVVAVITTGLCGVEAHAQGKGKQAGKPPPNAPWRWD